MSYLGIALVLVYTIGLLIVAWRGSREQKKGSGSSRSYFLGNGSGTAVILFSIIASGGSAWLFQGGPAAVYANGISYLSVCVIWSLSYYILYGYFAPRGYALGKAHGVVTLGDMFEKYYSSSTLAVLVAVMQLVALIPSCIAQTKGMGLAIEILSGGLITKEIAIPFAALVIVLYCTAGGFGSLSRVDMVQGIMFTLIIWVGLIAVFAASGQGLAGMFDTIEANNPGALIYPTDKSAYWALGFGLTYALCQTIGNMAQPILWQRFFAAKSGAHLKQMARFLAPVYGILVLTFTLFIGLCMNAFDLTGVSPDNAFQTIMGNINPVFGLIVGMGIIAAAMSTAAGALFTMSTVATMSIVRTIRPDMEDAKLKTIGKVLIVVIAIFSVWQALKSTTPLSELAIIGISLYAAGALPLFGMFLWKRATAAGSCAGIAAMLISSIYFYWINPNMFGIFSGAWALLTASVFFVVVSLLTKPVDPLHREKFMAPIRPRRAEIGG